MDVRKTKIRPLYVPNPDNADIEKSCIFRMTGGSYFWQFSIFDGNPNVKIYKDYTEATFVPDFTHHKLTAFEFVDGVNLPGGGYKKSGYGRDGGLDSLYSYGQTKRVSKRLY